MRGKGRGSMGSYVPFLLFVVCLGGVAILSGYYLGKYIVSSLSSLKTPSTKDKAAVQDTGRPAPAVTLSAKGMTLQRVQAGLFNVRDNAEKMVAQLEKAGIPATMTAEAPYRVIVTLLPSPEAARTVAQSVKAKGFEVMVGKYELQGRSFKVQGEPGYTDIVKSAVDASWDAIDKSLRAADAYILGRQPDTKQIVDATSQINDVMQKLAAAKAPEGGDAVRKGAESLLSSASGALQSLTAAASSGQPSSSVLGDIAKAVLAYEKAVSALPGE
ncbi:MAG: SPOR domain-containing protein [Ignavibacteriales bacterium]